jgi:uncharacterized glyoxalase superfamily protein PhnB
MLAYEDPRAALEWLSRSFGFRERTRIESPNGQIVHAEMEIGDGVIMLATPSPEYQAPATHRRECARADRWLSVPYVVDGNLVHVDDVDRHFAIAKAAGAIILSEPEDEPYGRVYRVEDLEGHRWMFLQASPADIETPGSARHEWVPPEPPRH